VFVSYLRPVDASSGGDPLAQIVQAKRTIVRWLTGCALVVAVAAALPAAALAADAETTLAERYVPVVRIVDQEEQCGHGEAYQPTDVNLVLGNPDVAFPRPLGQDEHHQGRTDGERPRPRAVRVSP
jgi:hypothetical protein